MEPKKSGSGTIARTTTLDRIEPKKGYVIGNVRLICFIANNAKYTFTDEELRDFCKTQIAPFKAPREIEFVPELPRTETGKLQRYKLRL